MIDAKKYYIVGVGGVGGNLAFALSHYLSVYKSNAKIILIDDDVVDAKYYGRYIFLTTIFGELAMDMPKVDVVAESIRSYFSSVEIETVKAKAPPIPDADTESFVFITVDSLQFRDVIEKWCIDRGIPYLHVAFDNNRLTLYRNVAKDSDDEFDIMSQSGSGTSSYDNPPNSFQLLSSAYQTIAILFKTHETIVFDNIGGDVDG